MFSRAPQVVDLKRQKERNGSKGSALETLGWEFSVEKGGKRMGKSWGLWDNPHENLEVLMDI
jgi:hypothetical protein